MPQLTFGVQLLEQCVTDNSGEGECAVPTFAHFRAVFRPLGDLPRAIKETKSLPPGFSVCLSYLTGEWPMNLRQGAKRGIMVHGHGAALALNFPAPESKA
jgi:hypothetical protein